MHPLTSADVAEARIADRRREAATERLVPRRHRVRRAWHALAQAVLAVRPRASARQREELQCDVVGIAK